MAETQAWRDSRVRRARGEAPVAARAAGRRARRALWSLLHARALLDGSVGGPYDVAVVEDDRRRLAARRTT
jgi:hypothetical protein